MKDEAMTAAGNDAQMYRRLLSYLWPYRSRLSIAVLCMIVLAATTAALAWALKPAIDEGLSGKNPELIYLIPLLIIVLYVIKGMAFYGQTYFMSYIGQRIIMSLRNDLYEHLLKQSLSFFAHHKTGEVITRMSYDATLVQSAVSTSVTALMRDLMSIVFLLAVIFFQDWLLALLAILVFPIIVYPIVRFGKKMRRATTDGQAAMGALSSHIEETVGGVRVVKAFAMESYEQSRFNALTQRFFGHQMRAVRVNALSLPIMEFVAGLGIAGVLFYGGLRVSQGLATPGTLMSFLAALIMLYEPVKRLSRANNEIQQGLAAGERVFAILDAEPEVLDAVDAKPLKGFHQELRYEQVSLRYANTDRDVLHSVSLRVGCGEVVALVGRSGAGKSSMANMLVRFMDPSSGAVLIDGQDIRQLTQASLRQHIALVTQEIILFNDTVWSNLSYGRSDYSKEQIMAAAKAANAHEFIQQLPKTYDTLVGERGVLLSGGQRQRLSLARALLKDAPILILDEATSSLDTESERLVQQAIDRLMQHRTVVVIAHRLSTIQRADRIIVLDQGKIVEQGQHQELLAQQGLYAELYRLQFDQ